MYKNISKNVVFEMKNEVDYHKGQVVSKTLVQNERMGITVFSFDKGEEISTHASTGDALVTVLEGTGKFVVDGKEHVLHEGESLIMPATLPHSVHGIERFKMLLVVSL